MDYLREVTTLYRGGIVPAVLNVRCLRAGFQELPSLVPRPSSTTFVYLHHDRNRRVCRVKIGSCHATRKRRYRIEEGLPATGHGSLSAI